MNFAAYFPSVWKMAANIDSVGIPAILFLKTRYFEGFALAVRFIHICSNFLLA